MAAKTIPLSASRAGLGSIVVTDDSSHQGTFFLSNIGIEFSHLVSVVVPGTGAAEMDGKTAVQFVSPVTSGAAEMDGLTRLDFHGALGSAAAQMDGHAAVAFSGAITGGFHVGAAHMDGAAVIAFAGVAITVRGAAQMNGQGSMLAVQAGARLPSHGIILAAGI